MTESHETKRASLALAQATTAGRIEGYASLFGVADSGGDIVMPGAFSRSLTKRGAEGVKLLWQHNATEPIGVWSTIIEDSKGLKVTGRLDLSVSRAREALSLIRSGAVDGLSIGFRAVRVATDKSSGLRRLAEIDLLEISVVTFPMQTLARINSIKRAPERTGAAQRAALVRLKAQEAALRFEHRLRRLDLRR
ncbi:HK97 family phage prohead protease [Methylocystis sp. IM3]|uniref:HK97 family phage prohead protease n=1 Tax=unclassified Methylocystis TaxID=2625913 RepID=UPI0030F64F85